MAELLISRVLQTLSKLLAKTILWPMLKSGGIMKVGYETSEHLESAGFKGYAINLHLKTARLQLYLLYLPSLHSFARLDSAVLRSDPSPARALSPSVMKWRGIGIAFQATGHHDSVSCY